jgi:hypothetical protein
MQPICYENTPLANLVDFNADRVFGAKKEPISEHPQLSIWRELCGTILGDRPLCWRTRSMTPSEITSALGEDFSYNGFFVSEVTDFMNEFGLETVQVAREGSMAIYVQVAKRNVESVMTGLRNISADEVDVVSLDRTADDENDDLYTIRAWWD